MALLDGKAGKNWQQRSKALEHFRRTVGAEAGTGVNLHVTQQMAIVNADRPRSFEDAPRFYPLRAPDEPDVAAVAETVSRRTQALWRKKGIGASDDGEAEDPLRRDTPWLAGLYAHGVRGRTATGPNTGKRIRTWGGGGESEEPEPSARRCANVDGFGVHARERLRTQARQGAAINQM
jgi:hypothetical protein